MGMNSLMDITGYRVRVMIVMVLGTAVTVTVYVGMIIANTRGCVGISIMGVVAISSVNIVVIGIIGSYE
jgi:hypothetical protein